MVLLIGGRGQENDRSYLGYTLVDVASQKVGFMGDNGFLVSQNHGIPIGPHEERVKKKKKKRAKKRKENLQLEFC